MKELIINGVTVDLDDKTKMDLQFVSFLFTSINSISAPRSWTVSLPKSAVNMGLIQGASSGDYAGNGVPLVEFPYKNYTVDYYNRGFRLINDGKAILTKIGTRIEFVFTFGKAFEKIKILGDTKLTQLEEVSTDYLAWNQSINFNNMAAGFGWCNFYSFTNEDRSYNPLTGHVDIPFSTLHPIVKFDYIMNKIQSFFGVTLVGLSTLVGSCSFPLREEMGISSLKNEVSSTSSSATNGSTDNRLYFVTQSLIGFDSDGYLFTKKTSLFDKKVIVKINSFEAYSTNASGYIGIRITTKKGVNRTITSAIDEDMGGFYKFSITDYTFTLNEDDASFSFICSLTSANYYDIDLLFNTVFAETAAYNGQSTGGYYPIIPNLPDMTCADFLFQAMQLAGVFPEVSDATPNTINFFSADILFDNIDIAKDWTNKLVKSTKRMSELSDVEFKFGSYAKKNTLAYKKDETNLLVTDDYLIVENDNLEDESKLVDLKFAAGKRFSVSEKTIDYPLYDIKIESGTLIRNPKSQSNDVLGKIVNISGINYLQFTDDLLWSNIKLTDNYSAQQTLLNKPRYIKENFYLKPEDVYNFSTKVPIYLQQYGKYYAVMKLQYRETDFSECELLELKNV